MYFPHWRSTKLRKSAKPKASAFDACRIIYDIYPKMGFGQLANNFHKSRKTAWRLFGSAKSCLPSNFLLARFNGKLKWCNSCTALPIRLDGKHSSATRKLLLTQEQEWISTMKFELKIKTEIKRFKFRYWLGRFISGSTLYWICKNSDCFLRSKNIQLFEAV